MIEELEVFFPYDYIYKEQYDYMYRLKLAISEKRHALLEMPTGTGKTVCLLSLITSYQYQYPLETGKLIYCTRTVPEMVKCMDEIKKVIGYRNKVLGLGNNTSSTPSSSSSNNIVGGTNKVLALCLSSRRNMCIHPVVMNEGDRDTVDSACRSMTASWVRMRPNVAEEDLCQFYENYYKTGQSAEVPTGVYSLDDMKELGAERGCCPYYMTRYLLRHANIVVFNYQYMLDPKVASLVSRELEKENIVVFDEAHNIDNVCIEALSVALDKRKMDAALRGVGTYLLYWLCG
jgi:DNA excision repair protein ERCC-2